MTSPGTSTSERIFSMLAWRTSRISAALPPCSSAPSCFMNLSSTPASLAAPAAAPPGRRAAELLHELVAPAGVAGRSGRGARRRADRHAEERREEDQADQAAP